MSVLLMSDIIIVTRESVIAEERGIYVEHTKADIIFKDFGGIMNGSLIFLM